MKEPLKNAKTKTIQSSIKKKKFKIVILKLRYYCDNFN